MKLILLPGMDGTGTMFAPVIPALKGLNPRVLPLPQEGPQDYRTLTEHMTRILPREDFILLAESFSGGIAARLSQRPMAHLKGIIFVAAFLSAPQKTTAYLASVLPIPKTKHLPFADVMYRKLFLGNDAERSLVELFQSVIVSVPDKTLKMRLRVIAQSEYNGFRSNVPAVYIRATQDKLVNINKRAEFAEAYTGIVFSEIDGPHAILQSRPKQSASATITAMEHLMRKTKGS